MTSRNGFAGFFRDNLEAFAVAIAMALVIRHFCVEAFRIPTSSMVPTLLGDNARAGQSGDRILVDKFVFLRRDPERWEVIVFQYPLNRNRNFIKRLIGLPEEWLRIVDGDIWVSRDEGATWSIQRKPEGVREQLLFAYYPRPAENPDYFEGRDAWEGDPGWEWSERARRFQVDAAGEAALTFTPSVTPYGMVDGGRPFVGDVRLGLDVEVQRAGTLTLRLTEHGRPHRLVLGPAGSEAVVAGPEGVEHRFPLAAALEPGGRLSVSFANVDDTLVVDIDGDVDLHEEIPFPDGPAEPADPSLFGDGVQWDHGIELVADGLQAVVTDLAIDRDVYYDPDDHAGPLQVWEVPAASYFVLGDNTRSSKDSRLWKVGKAILEDGTEVVWESDSDVPGQPPHRLAPGGDEGVIRVAADIDGLVRLVPNRDVARWELDVAWPWVPHDHLVGRAFAIFWPIYIPPLYRGPTRVDLIR